MSNYTILTDWVGKDSLSDTHANKVISGSDFQTEFEAIRASLNSKAEDAGNATDVEVATALVGHATQVAIIGTIYPVGSLYTSTLSTNPATTLGVGTWTAFGEGQVVVGKAASGTFGTAAATGGSETHTLTTNEMPSHDHDATYIDGSYGSSGSGLPLSDFGPSNTDSRTVTFSTTTTGGGTAHNNLQPYIVVYMWKRTV